MSRPFWLRPLRLMEKPMLSSESVAKCAARGEPLAVLLQTASDSLLENSNADRVGVWAEQLPGDPTWLGQIAQVEAVDQLSEPSRVNAFEVFPIEFSDANCPLEFFAPVFPVGPRHFFEGISTAVGVPLRVNEHLLGALIVGTMRPGKLASRESLENLAAEIAVSLFANRSREYYERAQRTLQFREEVDNLILRGAAEQDVLRCVAATAVTQTNAQFVGIARRAESGVRWDVLCGPDLPSEPLKQPLFTVATAVFLDRDSVIRDFPNGSLPGSSIVGLPLDFSQDQPQLLLAGYRSGDRIPLETLEGFRAIAANGRFTVGARDTHFAYHSLFESASEAFVVTDTHGKIMEANRHAREMLRCKSEVGLDAKLSEFLDGPEASGFDVWLERAASAARAPGLQVLLDSGLDVRLALRQVLAGGARLLLSLEEGSIVQRAESRWRQTQAELCSVLDAVQEGILLVETDGRIRWTNAGFGMLFGLDARSLRALETFEDLAHMVEPRFRAGSPFRAPWDAFRGGSGDAIHDELEMTTPGGRSLERYARPVLDEEGRRLGWLETFSDLMPQRQIQSKLQQTEKMAAVGLLISGIAHELNNPLTSIMGYAQLLLSRHTPDVHSGEAQMIFEEAERARRIVKNLLSYTRQIDPERTATDVNEVVERTVALRGYELRIQNIMVRCELEPDLPATLADAHQLQQVILNLLINAEQAILSSRGRGHIYVRTRRISEARFSFEIADDGPGIPPEISSRMFDPFFTTKPDGVGTGLGLPIVFRIVEQHGGRVSFANRSSGGAKFTVELPLLPIPKVEPPSHNALAPDPRKKVAASRILVVEDEPTVAQLVADVLREEGHDVEAVLDSQEGLQRISHNCYDLIICDLRMPRLDGPAFYDALVRARSTARHRILFITGDTLGPNTVKFLESHQLQYLTKPFLVEELKLAVCRVVERSVATATNQASSEAHG